jgi:hypothetical protein
MAKKRIKNDNYPTPLTLARVGWGVAQRYVAAAGLTQLRVCEPGCGDVQPFLAAASTDPRVIALEGSDLRNVAAADPRAIVTSGVDWTAESVASGPWDVIVTNPPFSVAEAFARRSLPRLAPGGVLVLLVRLSFLGSAARRDFWRDHPLTELCIIRPRPSFDGSGGSDTSEYAWCVWAPSLGQAPTITWCDWAKPRRIGLVRMRGDVDMLI